ncbi:hypothetical protein PHYSODRAFT_254452 [Phytophthora sojae]|uniref:RxLR effector protein n=1 Tax=Phytophthora sojae (strain P6497) TaxID=1094619 RepID=G5AE62_PHYSP|nr:hypothetical protein PHYSODRAFT_254452 [Phytophthora sojae]EGZ06464.1 hypothetical protein PHYSODRAFT_254452 [Phytophthora sojae]|eukprot:XP_009538361.1 hypothetical protein PHYSODRAFT_254452 [Phytophthora sojae]
MPLCPVDEAQALDAAKRFLRSDDILDDAEDSEERAKLPAGLLKPENLKVDDLLNKNMLDRARNGNKKQRNKLFSMWAAAPKKERMAAIQKILNQMRGFTKNKKFFNAWNKYSHRLDGGVTRNTRRTN